MNFRRCLVDARPSYRYRRITALLSRQVEAKGLARANHNRVYRVMKWAGRLLAAIRGVDASGGMTVRARPASNWGWAADVFENRAGTAMPCEVRSPLTPRPRDSRLDRQPARHRQDRHTRPHAPPIEHRFDALRTAQPIESLADNGSCFIAHGRSRSQLA